MADARFADGDEGPLLLIARGPGDVPVLSALVQDAVLPPGEMRYAPKQRRFAALLNRFRWEDREAAEREGRPYERVRSLLTVEDVLAVRSAGIDHPDDSDAVLSILSLDWQPAAQAPAEDVDPALAGPGRLVLILAGGGAIALELEALEIRLEDVTRPYLAPSRKRPDHEG
ncbi:DUF2948 family protein [Pseudogemmobacter sonorensis]|uniref:DUF2948 family protein n=1 Tax=Pseudogemmobacter sonorensis TaxID=2989681 RepID=UPI00367C4F1D